MKLGVFSVMFRDRPIEEVIDYVASLGIHSLEIGVGGYVGKNVPVDDLLKDSDLRHALREKLAQRGVEISALSCHGNPLHPNDETAQIFHRDFEDAVRLAEALEVPTIVTFSGCPGESDRSRYPVWVVTPWPDDFQHVLQWQWEEKVLPYWSKQQTFCQDHGVRVALELHPGFVVYNTQTLLHLRAECGDRIGANCDPSHLFWQNMDPVSVIDTLGSAHALYHFHAKDTALNPSAVAVNGVLDTQSYRDIAHRSWAFRTVGFGHGEEVWRRIISALQIQQYDGPVSIEHEDGLMDPREGLEKAVRFLQGMVIEKPAQDMWWA
ncbi:MAG: xylose isomerase [Sulfobacillus acidophilus]|uniref:Xylose isomerase n=1 Tax=Sulfobacillus acidophilus TaxID=53633 RepID=A0A2T2WJM4_9FIRM|nr:MAG: xylose isomerase [Sulfobacillus acidophilus]